MKNDGGYGEIGNEAMLSLLSSLNEDKRNEFEEYLKSKDEKAYRGFKEWEKEWNKY